MLNRILLLLSLKYITSRLKYHIFGFYVVAVEISEVSISSFRHFHKLNGFIVVCATSRKMKVTFVDGRNGRKLYKTKLYPRTPDNKSPADPTSKTSNDIKRRKEKRKRNGKNGRKKSRKHKRSKARRTDRNGNYRKKRGRNKRNLNS